MSKLVKTKLHTAIAEGIFRELGTRSSKYFFFLGKTSGDDVVTTPVDSYSQELSVRNDIVIFQEVKPADACLVVSRIDWKSGEIYDQYDDNLCTQLAGINLKFGGYGYSSTPNVVITGGGPNASGATAVATIDDQGRITDITLTNPGIGYTEVPTISFSGSLLTAGGTSATAVGVINKAASGATKLENALFYVITDNFNVYKCLSNNYGGESTVKPYGTSEKPIKTSDGYVWRYMYTVPVTLRNKFLTKDYMPVINNLNDNFYSNGEIGNVSIVSGGKNYTWAKVTVDGDGHLDKNPFVITGAYVDSQGQNYNSPEVSIQPPFVEDVVWDSGSSVTNGEIVLSDDRYYKVIVAGNFGTDAPVHRVGIEANGTALLEYVGETAKAILTSAGGKLTSISLVGRVFSIDLENGGSGYETPPSVTVIGNGTGASAYAQTLSGVVSSIKVVMMGDNYTQIPDVVIGNKWQQLTVYGAGNQIFYEDNLYTVIQSGTTGTFPPLHVSGEFSNGTAVLRYVGKAAKARAKLLHGYGYTFLPDITITTSGDNGKVVLLGENSRAKIIPIVNNGSIVSVVIEDAGIGYTYASLTVEGDGTGAELKVDTTVGDVNSVQGLSQLLGAVGSIHHIELLSGGYGYGESLPSIQIVGDGEGCVAMAELNPADGADKLLKVVVTNPGKNYTWARVQFNGGSGHGAKARAVISPYGGHAKDSVAELFAQRLMFYTVFSGEKLFQFDIDNEYRQVGIVRNPRNYTNTSFIAGGTHTPCIIVSGNFVDPNGNVSDSSKFQNDMEIRSVNTNKKYRVISKTEKMMLLQDLQNSVPELGDKLDNQLSGSELSTFIIESVISPTIDKYSGDLLYIENRSPFRPTKTESVALRSIVTF